MGNVRRPIKSRLEQQVAHWDVMMQDKLGIPLERQRPRDANRYLNHHFVQRLMGWPREGADAKGYITPAQFDAWKRVMSASAQSALHRLYS
jgi:hypothetical protein